jgi:plasmid stability protein
MCCACDNVKRMSKMIQIRNVPDDLHRRLKVRAAEKGMSLSDYLLSELEWLAETPTVEELAARLRSLPPLKTDIDAAAIIREVRDRT